MSICNVNIWLSLSPFLQYYIYKICFYFVYLADTLDKLYKVYKLLVFRRIKANSSTELHELLGNARIEPHMASRQNCKLLVETLNLYNAPMGIWLNGQTTYTVAKLKSYWKESRRFIHSKTKSYQNCRQDSVEEVYSGVRSFVTSGFWSLAPSTAIEWPAIWHNQWVTIKHFQAFVVVFIMCKP